MMCRGNAVKTTLKSRLKLLQVMSGFNTRKDFSIASGVPISTLEAWENGKRTLTVKGAERISDAVYRLGISCSKEWILSGTGAGPRRNGTGSDLNSRHSKKKNCISILKQLEKKYPVAGCIAWLNNPHHQIQDSFFLKQLEKNHLFPTCMVGSVRPDHKIQECLFLTRIERKYPVAGCIAGLNNPHHQIQDSFFLKQLEKNHLFPTCIAGFNNPHHHSFPRNFIQQ